MVTLFVSLFVFTMDLNRISQTKYPGYKSFAKFVSDIPKSLNLDYLFKCLFHQVEVNFWKTGPCIGFL